VGSAGRASAANFTILKAGDFMDNEANCVVTFSKQKAEGKAFSELIFRSEDGAMRT
jgi:hypothetical protein